MKSWNSAISVAVHPQMGDRSLLRVRGRETTLPLTAEDAAELLNSPVVAEPRLGGSGPRDECEAAKAAKLLRGIALALGSARPGTGRAESPRRPVRVALEQGVIEKVGVRTVEALFRPVAHAASVSVVDIEEIDTGNESENDELLVTLSGFFDYERLTGWQDWAARTGRRWTPAWFVDGGLAYGPHFEDGRTPGIRDYAARRVAAARQESTARAALNRPVFLLRPDFPASVLVWFLASMAADVDDWLGGRTARASWHVVELDAVSRTARRRPVFPLSFAAFGGGGTPVPDPAHSALTADEVVDPVTGIVVDLRPVAFTSSVPRGISFFESKTADMSRLTPWAANIFNAGSSWDGEALARQSAVGEAVERYCGNVADRRGLRRASFNQLRRQGDRAVDPRALVLFSERQYSAAGFPFVPFDPDLTTSWTLGRSLVAEEDVWVPASLVYVNWNSGDSAFDPPTNPAYYPGIAAGLDPAQAVCNALEEVVERDAAMVWWLSGAALPASRGPLNEFVAERQTRNSTLSAEIVPIPNAVRFPVMAGVVTDSESGVCTMGLAARRTPEEAAKKALLEAFGLLESALDMHRPDGGFWQALDAAGAGARAIKPVRPDRRYLDSYRPDFRDVTDLFCQLQVQLDPRARTIVSRRWHNRSPTPWTSLVRLPERSADGYVKALADAGFEPFCVDVTTADVRAAGWHVVRVVVPGLTPNFPSAFPPLGRARVQTEPVRLGWFEHPLREDQVFRFPMPYA